MFMCFLKCAKFWSNNHWSLKRIEDNPNPSHLRLEAPVKTRTRS